MRSPGDRDRGLNALQDRLAALESDLARCPPFHRLSAEGRKLLLGESKLACFAAGDAIYTSGRQAEHLILLLEGALQIEYPPPPEERGRVIAMVRAPFMIGEAHVFHDRPWSGTGIALDSAVVSQVERDLIEKLVVGEPTFALAFIEELSYRFLQTLESRRREVVETSEAALAKYVLSYVELTGGDAVPLQQLELGRATGLSRETVNRILKRWADDGHVVNGRNGLSVRSLEGLRLLLDPAQAPLLLHHPLIDEPKRA
jgi:CRP-like cAMP-binding protein